jgi:hypothetical protein
MSEQHVTDSGAEVVRAYLVPSGPGAEFACASNRRDARRAVLWGLLRGAAGRPVPLARLAEWTGIGDRREIRALLLRLQREGLLNGDVEPFAMPDAAYDEVLVSTLGEVSAGRATVLADAWGLAVAHAACSRERARRLALAAASLSPLVRTTGRDATEAALTQIVQAIRDRDGDEFVVCPIYLERMSFFLVLPRDLARGEERSSAFARLMALLGRRYLGES